MKTFSDILQGSRVLITGGTGSFGNELTKTLLRDCDCNEIRIFSRDEKKQYDMRTKFQNDRIRYIIGDVRDSGSVAQAMRGADYVFHAAALKQVPSCEFFPFQAVKTNILGTENVLRAAGDQGVSKVVCLSTDKAVYPINAMGMTKAVMEKLVLAKARDATNTIYCCVRYGNVMFSRGSALPLFLEQAKAGKKMTVTNPDMTRFLLPLPVAIDLVLHALAFGEQGHILVRKSPAASVASTAIAMARVFSVGEEYELIGTREGEKVHETLVTSEELMKATSSSKYYAISSLETTDYAKYFVEGDTEHVAPAAYTSASTEQLSVEEVQRLLLSLDQVQNALK
ncbi:MAG: UDP-N-acetylglucosamine 4,6-dehydratase [Kiritimatiellia bacterium]|jgi:UDP-N-acetylglucosamine 4,6-dehydratase